MQALKYVRAEDQLETAKEAGIEIDPTPLLGEWINTNWSTRGIVKAVIRLEGNDVHVRIIGASPSSTTDWGETRADALYSSNVQASDAMALSATYDFGFLETRLEANLSLGLLVIANLNTFHDDSGRSNYFSREFFYHSNPHAQPLPPGAPPVETLTSMRTEDVLERGALITPGSVDPTPFLGDWISTNKATRGIARLTISGDDDGLKIHGFGAGSPSPHDWGGTRGRVFADAVTSKNGLAFRAIYDFGFKETHLQAKVKKGVLVVANLNKFKDGSNRSNYFSREFFYRTPA
jgi:hypothetical protein